MTKLEKQKTVMHKTFIKLNIAKTCFDLNRDNMAVEKIVADIIEMKRSIVNYAKRDDISAHDHCRNRIKSKDCISECCSIVAISNTLWQDFYIAISLLTSKQRQKLEKCFIAEPRKDDHCCLLNDSGCFFENLETRPVICSSHYCLNNIDFQDFGLQKRMLIQNSFKKMADLLNINDIMHKS